jgi:hypothetical protein
MSTRFKPFPIPILWVVVFAWLSLGLLFALNAVSQIVIGNHHQGKIFLILALVVIPGSFIIFHRIGLFAESRGWNYYRHPRTGGVKAGVALDLEVLLTARPTNQIENLRNAYEAHNESAKQDGEGDKPPEKKTYRHE